MKDNKWTVPFLVALAIFGLLFPKFYILIIRSDGAPVELKQEQNPSLEL